MSTLYVIAGIFVVLIFAMGIRIVPPIHAENAKVVMPAGAELVNVIGELAGVMLVKIPARKEK